MAFEVETIRIVKVTDDMDGSKGTEDEGFISRFKFGVQGKNFELSLSPQNAKAFLDAIAPFVAAYDKIHGPTGTDAYDPQTDAKLQKLTPAQRDWNLRAKTYCMEHMPKQDAPQGVQGPVGAKAKAFYLEKNPADPFPEAGKK